MTVASKEQYREKAYAELKHKANILVYGISADDATAERTGAGSTVKEGSFHRLGNAKLPVSFDTPMGLTVAIRKEEDSLYSLRYDESAESFFVERNGDVVFERVTFPPRPAFYKALTTDGKEMKQLVSIMETGCASVWFTNECAFKEAGKGCLFCAISYTPGTAFLKTPEQIAECVKAAFDEGVAQRVDFSGGVIEGRREIDYYADAMRAIRAALGDREFPAAACIAAPRDLANITLLKEAGFTVITMNKEVWDENIFKTICPGKATAVGHGNWIKALEFAAETFGFSHVRCNFVTGLEPKFKTIEGIKRLSAIGVVPNPNIFDPVRGTPLEGMRCPTPEWNLDLHEQTCDILRADGHRFEDVLNCHPISSALYHDFWRIKEDLLWTI
ncbi:MAG: hypothetical protein LBC41_14240 [Clostridiales bacterium]|nr:hypothetical protein [Clostridiales bacterium]MDR2751814.1 hypothetical protein [Clostridiales bacterium]